MKNLLLTIALTIMVLPLSANAQEKKTCKKNAKTEKTCSPEKMKTCSKAEKSGCCSKKNNPNHKK